MRKFKVKVSSKGWVVIPVVLRKQFNIKPGEIVELAERDGEITITPPCHKVDLLDKLYGKWAHHKSLIKSLIDNRVEEFEREEKKIRTG